MEREMVKSNRDRRRERKRAEKTPRAIADKAREVTWSGQGFALFDWLGHLEWRSACLIGFYTACHGYCIYNNSLHTGCWTYFGMEETTKHIYTPRRIVQS